MAVRIKLSNDPAAAGMPPDEYDVQNIADLTAFDTAARTAKEASGTGFIPIVYRPSIVQSPATTYEGRINVANIVAVIRV